MTDIISSGHAAYCRLPLTGSAADLPEIHMHVRFKLASLGHGGIDTAVDPSKVSAVLPINVEVEGMKMPNGSPMIVKKMTLFIPGLPPIPVEGTFDEVLRRLRIVDDGDHSQNV